MLFSFIKIYQIYYFWKIIKYNKSKMTSRRNFFKTFLGQTNKLAEDIGGMEYFPLNRLPELPYELIQEIIPVFIEDEVYEIIENDILINRTKINLTDYEMIALDLFSFELSIQDISLELAMIENIDIEKSYQIVSSLFFKLAKHRICRPNDGFDPQLLIKKNEFK